MKKLIAVLASAALALTSVAPANAKAWTFDPEWSEDMAYFKLEEGYNSGQASFISVSEVVTSNRSRQIGFCENYYQGLCDEKTVNGGWHLKKGRFINAELVAGVCKSPEDDFCIEDVRIYKTGEAAKSATLIRETEVKTIIPANSKLKTPEGRSPSLWSSEVQHLGGQNTYSVYVMMSFTRDHTKKFVPNGLKAIVSPYNEITGEFYQDTSEIKPAPEATAGFTTPINYRATVQEGCAWMETGKCGQIEDFADGTRVGLTIRIRSDLGGFFNGRLKNPDLSVAKFNSATNRVKIDADAVKIGRLAEVFDRNSEVGKKIIEAGTGSGGYLKETSMGASKEVEILRTLTQDRNSGESTIWRLSIDNNEGQYHPCFKKPGQLVGLVTTNAMTYKSGPPQMRSGYLNYEVAGMHFESDGAKKNLGTYDLVLRSDVARCLYGFSKAPLTATVSVTGGTGKNVATTVVGEKNGWLKMAAYGFTFSKKTIKVKITKKKK
jgi:hypothetical protein